MLDKHRSLLYAIIALRPQLLIVVLVVIAHPIIVIRHISAFLCIVIDIAVAIEHIVGKTVVGSRGVLTAHVGARTLQIGIGMREPSLCPRLIGEHGGDVGPILEIFLRVKIVGARTQSQSCAKRGHKHI